MNIKAGWILLLIASACVISACSRGEDGVSWEVRERCYKGVVYYEGARKLAPAFKQDGTLYLCQQ